MFTYSGRAKRVIDGDTLEIMIDYGFKEYGSKMIRLFNIDTPEIYRPHNEVELNHGREAKKFVQEVLGFGNFTLVSHKDKTGKYGRYLADIFLNDEMKSRFNVKGNTLTEALKEKGFEKKSDEEYEKLLSAKG